MKSDEDGGWTPERIAGMARLKAQQDSRIKPQSTWVGLTDADRFELAKAQLSWEDLLIAVEAKLKEKNT